MKKKKVLNLYMGNRLALLFWSVCPTGPIFLCPSVPQEIRYFILAALYVVFFFTIKYVLCLFPYLFSRKQGGFFCLFLSFSVVLFFITRFFFPIHWVFLSFMNSFSIFPFYPLRFFSFFFTEIFLLSFFLHVSFFSAPLKTPRSASGHPFYIWASTSA